jgi:type II secretory pathway pseudopilin PulG
MKFQFHTPKSHKTRGFSFVEVCVAIVVCVLFGAAAFTTNERLLIALKSQKETTAATMVLQQRMEAFRALSYSNVANKTYVSTNIVPLPSTDANLKLLESPLGNLSETTTVSGYTATSGYTAVPSTDYNQWIRDSAHTTGAEQNHDDNLATQYDLLKVDILLTWTSANGRTRTRELAAIFGKGNIGP